MKLGSLFDGSGGFPLAGTAFGIEPVWASEIEPFPMRVTAARFSHMKQLGDIRGINGAEIEPVDIITFGSPCQDLSVAGSREGIHKGERSSLFFEAIRVIKEMREATNGEYPRFAVWENVCFDADTLITCEDGYKRIADISIGQKVKTLSGKYYPVVKVYQTKKQEVIRVKTRGAEDIIVTPNHPFYAMKKIKRGRDIVGLTDPDWIPAEELTKDHLIAYEIDHPELPEDFISESEAWAVGRWLADGSVDLSKSNPRMFFSIGNGKESIARNMLGRLPYTIHENKPHSSATNFCFTSKEFYALIADAGAGAGYKQVPPYIFKLPITLQKAVLDGYTSGDGYIRTRDYGREFSADTASRKLAYGICRLIRNVYKTAANISVRTPRSGCIEGRIIKPNFPEYSVTAHLDSTHKNYRVDENFVWQPVLSIKRLHEKRTVYNLSVLEDNTYAANGIIVHNCGAFSSNGGEDFRTVLNEFCKIKFGRGISIPRPKKWRPAGCIVGDGFSISWRIYDAQFWGVPQRRKRIYLICDFRDARAGEILFKCKSLPGDSESSLEAWKRIARHTDGGAAGGAYAFDGEAGAAMQDVSWGG